MTQVDEDEGYRIIHQRIQTPIMVSNRSIMHCFYTVPTTDGTYLHYSSSQGNEAFLEKHKAKLEKDVVSISYIIMWHVVPVMDPSGNPKGCNITQMMHLDVAGSLPEMVKAKIGQEQAKAMKTTVEYVLKHAPK